MCSVLATAINKSALFIPDSLRSSIVISHLRHAGPGIKKEYCNTQPFVREFFGRKIVFAHNGLVRRIFRMKRFKLKYYFPIGTSDSEHAFCYLLDVLREELGARANRDPAMVARILNREALAIDSLGIFNFLWSDSNYLFAFRSDQLQVAQRGCICRSEEFKGKGLDIKMGPLRPSKNQRVLLVASVPLTKDDCWQPLPLKKVVTFHKGERI